MPTDYSLKNKGLSQRVNKLIAKWAHLIGGFDSTGKEHYPSTAEQRQHLFVVKNRDNESAVSHFVTGELIRGMIIDDRYDIDYLGLAKNWRSNKKVKDVMARQEKEISDGKIAKKRSLGIYDEEENSEEKEG